MKTMTFKKTIKACRDYLDCKGNHDDYTIITSALYHLVRIKELNKRMRRSFLKLKERHGHYEMP